MEEPKSLAKLRKEYNNIKEVAIKNGWEYEPTLEKYIRKQYKKSSSGGRLGNKLAHRYSVNDILDLRETIDYFDKQKKSNASKTENSQGTARQLALSFYFMVKAKHLPKGTLDYTKNARFIEFLTGKSSENVRKKLGSLKGGEVTGINSEKEIKNLINDLEKVKGIFQEVLFIQEEKLIREYILKLRNDLNSLDDL